MTDVQAALFHHACQLPGLTRWLSEQDEQQEYAHCQNALLSLREELEQRLGAELRELLSRYDDNWLVAQAMTEQMFFLQGLSMGLQLMAACSIA